MTHEEFLKFVTTKCTYETIYEDTEGRPILVISLLDAYGMVNKAQRPWVGLSDERIIEEYCKVTPGLEWAIGGLEHAMPFARAIEAAIRKATP